MRFFRAPAVSLSTTTLLPVSFRSRAAHLLERAGRTAPGCSVHAPAKPRTVIVLKGARRRLQVTLPGCDGQGLKGLKAPKTGAGRAPSRCARPKPLSKSAEARGVIHSWFAYQDTPHFFRPAGKNEPPIKCAGAFAIGFSSHRRWRSLWIGAQHYMQASNSDRQ